MTGRALVIFETLQRHAERIWCTYHTCVFCISADTRGCKKEAPVPVADSLAKLSTKSDHFFFRSLRARRVIDTVIDTQHSWALCVHATVLVHDEAFKVMKEWNQL